MPARVALMPVAVIVLLALCANALFTLSGGADLRAFEQHLSDQTMDKSDTTLVAQSFRSIRSNLSRIDLQVSSYASLPDTGRVRLLAGDGLTGPAVYSNTLDKVSFAENPYLTVSFAPIRSSAGVTYTLVFETPGQPLQSSFGLRYNSFDVLSSGKMYTDTGATDGDLVIATYYHYDTGDMLADLFGTLSANLLEIAAWVLLLMLPGLALLAWLPSRLTGGQRVLAAPGVTLLALPVFFLVLRAVGLPFGGFAMWLLLLLCVVAILARRGRGFRFPSITTADLVFWVTLVLVFGATLAMRLLPLRDLLSGMGLDAYHHTLIAEMFLRSGGVPSNYEPYASLASFTYHFGFHSSIASLAWLTGATNPFDVMSLMPQVGQVATALPVLALALFGWKVVGNRWAGLLAGALAGLYSIFPAYYVNWSRYTQGLGLALLPVAWVLYLEVIQRPVRPPHGESGVVPGAAVSWQTAIRQSGPYMLGVIGAAGLFLTHYRIAIVYAAFVLLYLVGRLVVGLQARLGLREMVVPFRRTALLTLLSVAALSPWLVNLAQNFRSHLVGRDTPTSQEYYDLGSMVGLLQHWSMLVMAILSVGAVVLAVRQRKWLLLLASAVWVPIAIWSNPYLLSWLPGLRLPYSGYLDVTTVAQSIWLPLCMLSGYMLASLASWVLQLGAGLTGAWPRVWRGAAAGLMAATLLLAGCAAATPTATTIDKKVYITDADVKALAWMRGNLSRDSYVLANPFAFHWSNNIYGSDAGMWVPLLAGVRASVPPLPAYNERVLDPNYLSGEYNLIRSEPYGNQAADWEALKMAGITHIFIGSRGGALDVPSLLKSDRVRMVFHLDGAWLFELR